MHVANTTHFLGYPIGTVPFTLWFHGSCWGAVPHQPDKASLVLSAVDCYLLCLYVCLYDTNIFCRYPFDLLALSAFGLHFSLWHPISRAILYRLGLVVVARDALKPSGFFYAPPGRRV